MVGLPKGNWSSPYWYSPGQGIQRAGCYGASWLHIICHIHTHTHRERSVYVIYTQARYNMRKVCKSSAICMQSGIRRAASSKTAAGLPPIEAAVVREGDGGGGQLISNASSHFSLSVCVCVLMHCTVASCARLHGKCFFNLPPKEGRVGQSRLGYYE